MCSGVLGCELNDGSSGMSQAQARIAGTVETFYGAADRTSEGAMAAHAYKSAIEELEGSISREFVRSILLSPSVTVADILRRRPRTARPSRSP